MTGNSSAFEANVPRGRYCTTSLEGEMCPSPKFLLQLKAIIRDETSMRERGLVGASDTRNSVSSNVVGESD